MKWNATWIPKRDLDLIKKQQKEHNLNVKYERIFGKSPWVRLLPEPSKKGKQPVFSLSHYERAELPK